MGTRLLFQMEYDCNRWNNDEIALDGLVAAMTWAGVTHMHYDDNRTTSGGHDKRDQWAWKVTALHFTTPTHHPLSERRCLDINSPRSDPECMWLLCPGCRWTIWASWSLARCCGCSEGTQAWSGWHSWYLTKRRAARGAWNASHPQVEQRRGPPGTDRRAWAPRWAQEPWGLAVSQTGWSLSGRISGLLPW